MDNNGSFRGRMNALHGKVLREAVEQKITDSLFVELGFNYEAVAELLGGSFDNAESINIFADPNRFLPGGSTAARQTALNPNAGQLYIESFPSGSEVRIVTKEVRLTTSYKFDFKKHFANVARHFGRHRLAALASMRIDEDRSQASRAMILGNPSFATGDLLNNSRFLRSRFYLDPASGSFPARALPGGGGDTRLFGPWTFTDSIRNETFQATIFDHPDGRSSATGGSRKDITTGSGTTGDDVTKPIFGPAQFAVDVLLGYSGKTKEIAGHKFGWRVQLNVRNLLDNDDLEPIRANLGGGVLDWGRTPPRLISLTSTFTF